MESPYYVGGLQGEQIDGWVGDGDADGITPGWPPDEDEPGAPHELPYPAGDPTVPMGLPLDDDDDEEDDDLLEEAAPPEPDPEVALVVPADPVPVAWSAPKFEMPADADPLAFEEAWNRLSTSTREAYQRELLRMAAFLQWPSDEPGDVLRSLAALGKVGASNAIRAYRDFGQVAPATRARRVAAISKMLRSLHQAGIVDWVPTAQAPAVHAVKNREGPPPAAVEKMLTALAGYSDKTAIRDYAILTLLYDSGMRRSELVSIRVGDFDAARRTVRVVAKGREHLDRAVVSVSTRACQALERWLQVRPGLPLAEHPMFPGDDPSERLSTSTVARVCADRGKLGGIVHLRPHGLRHTAATVAAQSGASSLQLAAYLRHADPKTSQRYIDDLGTQTRALTDLVGSGGSAGVGAVRGPSSTRAGAGAGVGVGASSRSVVDDDEIPF